MNTIFKNKILTVFILLTFFAACTTQQKDDNKAENDPVQVSGGVPADSEKEITFTADQYRLAGIETGEIELRNLSNIIKLSGMVEAEPQSIATISAPLGGYIKTAGLIPGQSVEKGQVLATLENPGFIDMQQDYLESRGKLEYLKEEYERQQKLREEDINATKTFQQVASEYKVMQARITALEQKMALAGINIADVKAGNISRTANLYAPISGFIKVSNVNIGNYVNPSDVLFEIVNTNDVHLTLNAFENDLAYIEEGQTVKFSLTTENDYKRTANIFLIGKSTSEDRIIPVYAPVRKEDKKGLLPGMYVKAWVETGTSKLTAVPTEAIVQLEAKDYLVFLKSETPAGRTFRLEQIKKGIEQEGFTSVTLATPDKVNGAKLVIKNAYSIISALRNAEEGE